MIDHNTVAFIAFGANISSTLKIGTSSQHLLYPGLIPGNDNKAQAVGETSLLNCRKVVRYMMIQPLYFLPVCLKFLWIQLPVFYHPIYR